MKTCFLPRVRGLSLYVGMWQNPKRQHHKLETAVFCLKCALLYGFWLRMGLALRAWTGRSFGGYYVGVWRSSSVLPLNHETIRAKSFTGCRCHFFTCALGFCFDVSGFWTGKNNEEKRTRYGALVKTLAVPGWIGAFRVVSGRTVDGPGRPKPALGPLYN